VLAPADEANESGEKEKNTERTKLYYTTDPRQQAYYVNLYIEKGIDVFVMDTLIDTQFASFIESKKENLKFLRVDAELGGETSAESNDGIKELFATASGKDKEKIHFAALGENGAAALLRCPEEGRRFAEMMKMYSAANGQDSFAPPIDEELVINTESPIIAKLNDGKNENAALIAKHIYLMAVIANRPATSEELKELLESDRAVIEQII